MATTPSSKRLERARRCRVLDLEEVESWPTVDVAAIRDPAIRQRFERLQRAITLFASGASIQQVLDAGRVGERWFFRLLESCRRTAPDGAAFGFRALVWRTCVTPPIRVAERSAKLANPSAGYSGYFRKLLRDKPKIETGLVAGLRRLGKNRLMPNTLDFRGVHRLFIRECGSAGLTEHDYPLNTVAKARTPLRTWLKTDFMSRFAADWFSCEVGPDAAQAAAYAKGNGQDTRLEEPYSAWQIDEMTVDLLARYRLLNETGDWDELDLERFQVIRVIALGSSVNLAWALVIARQVAAHDLVAVLWDAIHGPQPVERVISGLSYHPDGGYPANVIPELRYAVPGVIYIDNLLAHLADAFQRLVAVLWGAVVRVGRPGTPQERGDVESQIKLMATQLVHQMPAATGSEPTSSLRKRAARPVSQRVVADELEQTIDVYLANKNGLPAAAARYIAPLERLRRQVSAGAIKVAVLPVASRRAHLFYRPTNVTVRVDLKRGRRPFVNFLGVRYSSTALQNSFSLVGKRFVARCDPRDLRTIWLYECGTGHEWGCLSALGRWSKFPHDMRIRKLFLSLKRAAELGERADDDPLEQLYHHLRNRASSDRRDASRLAYLMRYLARWVDGADPAVQRACIEWKQAQAAANEPLPLPPPSRPEKGSVPGQSPRDGSVSVDLEPPPVVLAFPPTARGRIRR
jgi:putative transposase